MAQVHKRALMDGRKALNETWATSKPAIAGHPPHFQPLPVETSAGAGRLGVGRARNWPARATRTLAQADKIYNKIYN